MKFFSILLAFSIFCGNCLYAQKKSIKDYYDVFIKKTPKVYAENTSEKGYKWKILTHDSSNGYMKFSFVDAEDGEPDMTSPSYEMAVWKKADGGIVIGVFETFCGGEGCFGTLDRLRFFDANWNDITSSVFDKSAYVAKAKKCSFKSFGDNKPYKPGGSYFTEKDLTCDVKIPQFGTFLKVSCYVPGIAAGCQDEFKFDKAAGRFIIPQ
jgi:hypothetical protein